MDIDVDCRSSLILCSNLDANLEAKVRENCSINGIPIEADQSKTSKEGFKAFLNV